MSGELRTDSALLIDSFRPKRLKANLKLIETFCYELEIVLGELEVCSLDSIVSLTLQRVPRSSTGSIVGKYWLSSVRKKSSRQPVSHTLSNRCAITRAHFEPCTLSRRNDEQGNSLALICLLAFKRVLDFLQRSESDGVLSDSDILALSRSPVWSDRDTDLKNLISRIKLSGHPLKRRDRDYKTMPLSIDFLIAGDEIYNLICYGRTSVYGLRHVPEKEQGWVLNIAPSDIRIMDAQGVSLHPAMLEDWLTEFFSQRHSTAASSELASRVKKTRERHVLPPPQILDFQSVFESHAEGYYIPRPSLERRIDQFLLEENPRSNYLLLLGEADVGKTAAVVNFLRHNGGDAIYYFIDRFAPHVHTAVRFLKHMYWSLSVKNARVTDPDDPDFDYLKERFKRRIIEVSELIGANRRLVFIVDGLSEIRTRGPNDFSILDTFEPGLPSNVRFILSSQDFESINPFKCSDASNVVILDPLSPENLNEIHAYYSREFSSLDQGANGVKALTTASSGSFLYASLAALYVVKPFGHVVL